MMQPVKQIAIFILSVRGSRNFDKLKEDVTHSFGVAPSVLWGITPKELPCTHKGFHAHTGKIRSLSCSEVAAAVSHSRAREIAYTSGAEWSFFLEDDSDILQIDNSAFIYDVSMLPGNLPFLLHMFPEQNGILSNSKFLGMKTIRKMPDYANAYAVNRLGLNLLIKETKRNHLYLADWQRFPRSLIRIAPSRSIFRHPAESLASSLIAQDRIRIQSQMKSFKLRYRIKQFLFKIIRVPFMKFGSEEIEVEGLRSVLWK
jgi:hypothetical protein